MPIIAPPEKYIGKLLYLKLCYGWGWHGTSDGEPVDYAPIHAAGGCHVRVSSFFMWRDEVRGVVGKIEQPGHLFDTLWIVCDAMIQGEYDFTECICLRFDLELGMKEPSNDEWPRIIAGERSYRGYGSLAETERHIAQAFKGRSYGQAL